MANTTGQNESEPSSGKDTRNADSRYPTSAYGEAGGYYYASGDEGPKRVIGDYIAMFKERIWWLFISLFICIVGMGFYCIRATPQYTVTSRLQILRQQSKTVEFNEVADDTIRSFEDFNTETAIIDSVTIVQNVERRLTDADKRVLMAPYVNDKTFNGEVLTPFKIIYDNKDVKPMRGTLMVVISFTHPDRDIAAKVANLIAEEYIAYRRNKGTEAAMRAVDELHAQIDVQGRKVTELEIQMANMKERYNSISFDATTDINQQELLDLTRYLSEDKRARDAVKAVWQQVEEARKTGKNLWDVPEIAHDPRIPALLNRRTEINVEVASLRQIYKDKHPKLSEALNRQKEINDELNHAVDSVVASIQNSLETAEKNYSDSTKRIDDVQEARIKMEKIRPEYERLKRDLEGARNHYNYLYSRKQQAMAMSSDEGDSARIVDYAIPPIRPSQPRVLLDMALSVVIGLASGFGIIVLFVLLDDKIKSVFDVEQTLGTNILGVIPRIPGADFVTRARIVVTNKHLQSLEAFRSVYSSMKLNDDARKAKLILVTSTIPSEGKTFVTTNLALIHAAHGERVIVLDADLRLPNVAKSMGLDNSKGIISVVEGECTLDDAIRKNVEKNYDVLPAGGHTGDPTEIFSNPGFIKILEELRTRYDKIFLDSPPLAPVSDSLNILSSVDGVVYVIRFNTVRRKVAATCLKRIREANVPLFGAIMNGVATHQINSYYSDYYSSNYSHYYTRARGKTTKTTGAAKGNVPPSNGAPAKGKGNTNRPEAK
jgi:capsular exopolysaccharide synthesis family protein